MIDITVWWLVGTASLLGVLIGVLYADHKVLAIWMFFACVVLYALAGCLFWQQKVSPSKVELSHSLRLKVDGSFFSSTNMNAVIEVKMGVGDDVYREKIPLFLGVTLTNTGVIPIRIDRLSVWIRDTPGGNWTQLTNVPSDGTNLYWAYDPRSALLMNATTMQVLLGSKSLIPNIPVSGWMLLQYPPSFDRTNKTLQWKFKATDSAGNEYEQPVLDDEILSGQMKPNAPRFKITQTKEDITVYPIRADN